MAIIYDLFTGNILANNPEPFEDRKPTKAYLDQMYTEQDPIRSYAEIRERFQARFGDNIPAHFAKVMANPQKQPYMHGDPHNVSYHTKQKLFNEPMPIPCEVTFDSCHRIAGQLVLGSKCERGVDEPFPWMDKKYEVTLNFLRSLPNGTSLIIHTRSDLIACSKYVTEFLRLAVQIRILYTSENESVVRSIEPGTPSFERRKSAVKCLKEHGINARLMHHSIPEKFVKSA